MTGAIDAKMDLWDVDGHTELDDLNVSGVSTFAGAADFNGSIDVDGHTELDDLNVSGVSTFSDDVTVNANITIPTNHNLNMTGGGNLDLTEGGTLKMGSGGNTNLEIYNNGQVSVISDNDTTGIWGLQLRSTTEIELQKKGSGNEKLATFTPDGPVDLYYDNVKKFETTSDGIDVTGLTTTNNLYVSGVSTFTGAIDANGSIDVDGHTELDDVNVSGVSTFAGAADFNGSIDVDGHTELDDVNVSGAITATTFTGNLAGTINTAAQPNITSLGTLSALTVSGDITANGNIAGDSSTNITGIAGVTATTLSGTLQTAAQTNVTSVGTLSALTVSGDITANGNIAGDNSTNITGIAGVTATTLSGTLQTAAQTNVTSVGTLSALTVSGDITANGNIAGDNSTNITGIAGVTATTLSGTLQTAAQTNVTSIGTLTSLDVNGHSELDNVNVSGIITTASLNATGKLITTGIGISVLNGGGDTATIAGPANLILDPGNVGDNTGIVRIKGDLYVDGTETVVNSTTVEIADKVIGIATTCGTDILADGGGIKIGPDNTFLYEHNGGTNPSLKSSENLNVASGKHYQIAETDVLNSTTLGNSVVNSSLTNVGTLTGLNVNGIATATTFVGALTGTASIATNLAGGDTGDIPYQSSVNTTAFVDATAAGVGQVLLWSGSVPVWANVSAASGEFGGITIQNEGSQVGTSGTVSTLNFVGNNIVAAATANFGISTITVSDTPTFDSLNVTGSTTIPNISGITTFANDVTVGNGITFYASTGIVSATTFYGDGQNLSNLINQRIEGLQIFDEGVAVGAGYTFAALDVVGNNVSISAVGLGTTARITVSDTPTFDTVTVTNNITANGNIVGDNSTNISGINQVTATTFSGALSGAATQVTVADESSDTTCFPLFVTAATGGLAPKSGTNLTFNSADGTLTATDFNTTSDENLKDNIRTIEDPLAKVVEIRGVNFDWKETQKPSVGVIAQEVEKVFPELVANGEKKTVNYNGLIGLLIEVVKEQQTQINSLNERLSKLE